MSIQAKSAGVDVSPAADSCDVYVDARAYICSLKIYVYALLLAREEWRQAKTKLVYHINRSVSHMGGIGLCMEVGWLCFLSLIFAGRSECGGADYRQHPA